MIAPTTNLRFHDIPPPVPSARASHSMSDSSRPRGRMIFVSRRPLRMRHQMRSIPRLGRRSTSSPTHAASQTIVEGTCSNDPKPVSRGTGTETQHQSHPDCGTRPRSSTFSNSACHSEVDPVALEDNRRTVSPLHTSEASLSTSLRKVSSSTIRLDTPDLSGTEARTYVTALGTSATEMTNGPSASSNIVGINNELVEAISRNVAQQLHLLSIKGESKSINNSSKKPTPRKLENLSNESRTPSQSVALNHFIWELRQYAEQSGATGRLPILTPTPPHSSATLHTINALLPFRSEFKAAGLAVTSKDQAKPSSRPDSLVKARLTANRALKSRFKQPHLTQMDSNVGCPSPSTEIPFPPAKDMDESRYAMVDRHSPEQSTTVKLVQKKSRVCCPPCQPDDLCLSGDWNCLNLVQKPKPLYTESLYKEPLTGPTARIPKAQMHAFPNWPHTVLPEKMSNWQEGLDEDATSPTSRLGRNKGKMKETKQAFFSGPRTPPTVYSTSAKGLITPHDHSPSLNDHPQSLTKTRVGAVD
ncbi:hypothetical protein FGRMN_6266 [Fusarium graminum]|nr:hypothetical protein FGRMN_6266 [Fusarium graminum]